MEYFLASRIVQVVFYEYICKIVETFQALRQGWKHKIRAGDRINHCQVDNSTASHLLVSPGGRDKKMSSS